MTIAPTLHKYLAAENIEKVIQFTSVKDCAKAYFMDDLSCAAKLVPLFYKPIIDNQLKPGEKREMTVVFFVDPALVKDHDQDGLNSITLSYTMHAVRQAEPPRAETTLAPGRS